jgi:hypothetical protein
MIRLLLQFWPITLPLLLYLLWMWLKRRRARRAGIDIPLWKDGPWHWALVAALLIAIGGFLILGLSASPNRDAVYHPTQFNDGQLIRETME